MIITVLVLLHTIKCSGFFGKGCMEFTAMSPAPKALNVLKHSVDFKFHTFTVPSLDALGKMKHIEMLKFDLKILRRAVIANDYLRRL